LYSEPDCASAPTGSIRFLFVSYSFPIRFLFVPFVQAKPMKKLLSTVVLGLCLAALPAASHAQITYFSADLNGANESPANASPAIGTALITTDTGLNTMRVQVTFTGLQGNVTAAHIHSATAVAGTGTAGSYDQTFDMTLASSYRAGFITANGGTPSSAQAALFSSFSDGKAYLNIHTSSFSGGEIRGFLQVVPEPSTVAFGIIAAGSVLGLIARRRRS